MSSVESNEEEALEVFVPPQIQVALTTLERLSKSRRTVQVTTENAKKEGASEGFNGDSESTYSHTVKILPLAKSEKILRDTCCEAISCYLVAFIDGNTDTL